MIGTIKKMRAQLGESIDYFLPLGEQELHLNPLIGSSISFQFTGNIYCSACSKKTKKSYSQGHCFVCMRKLAACDMCVMKPETCHYDVGTCREPQWGDTHCMVPHYVYLSNTSAIKVGITRHNQIPTRWIDQGASEALAILKVKNRHLSGLVEIELARFIGDKTNWRNMLKGPADSIDLVTQARQLLEQIEPELKALEQRFGEGSIEHILESESVQQLNFPVQQYPEKIKSLNLDKEPLVQGQLLGIKGQYLYLDCGVINMRKYSSYELEWLS
ncbi:DUF2797 domain-containing protein [Alginatibacterium sediminis]|uniref:DUF2797 domain-containing protein n=1 Tax=Alginatibacterium sediminis TaxID=2164068 RepID=A0A420ELF7_9ALTE|nr:DUF2797 domain-containing protein [Alginatibacterium sediminis]RKF21424.1 DUF2797 domain-containing protein [Alginatibacterium sediminis]